MSVIERSRAPPWRAHVWHDRWVRFLWPEANLEPGTAGGSSRDEIARRYSYPPPTSGRPAVLRSNMLMTLDGSAVGPDGGSRIISGPPDRELLSVLRALADAVIVGAGTLRDEGYAPMRTRPELAELRREFASGSHPVPVIVTRSARLDPDMRFFAEAPVRPVVVTAAAPEDPALAERAEIVVAPDDSGGVDLSAMVAALAARGLTRLLTEGGPSLLNAALQADVIDDFCLTLAPRLVGGSVVSDTGEPAVPTRPLAGGPLAVAPLTMELAHTATAQGFLFLRYRRPARAEPDRS